MLWEIDILPKGPDGELARVGADYQLLTNRPIPAGIVGTARGYLLEGDLDLKQVRSLANDLLVDPLVENWACNPLPLGLGKPFETLRWTVMLKPGVMDPVAQSVVTALAAQQDEE